MNVRDRQLLRNQPASRNGTASSLGRGRSDVDYYEQQPFLEPPLVQPVKLTPSWEETNLPNDELNFKGVTMDQVELEMNPPVDRWKLVYWTFMLHGIGTLTPWNMFITARDYFVLYKLSKDYTGTESNYATYFLQYLGFASQGPNLIFNWLNIFIQIGGNLTTRIVWSIFIEVLLFIVTVVLAMVDSSAWPGAFFWATLSIVIVLNMVNGIYQNSVYGMAAKLPPKYTGSVILGTNVSGTLTAVINIVSIASTPNVRTAAIYYFITALFVLLACFDTYFALPLNRFYRYHEHMAQKEETAKVNENKGVKPSTPYFTIFKKCFPQCFNVFMVFFVTLSIFPAIHADIKMWDKDFFLTEKYFTAVTCFLTFNLFAMIGNIFPMWFTWPSPKYLVIPVVLRLLFIPFFIACNYLPQNLDRSFPVFIQNDWAYWVGASLLGLTSGYYSSLGMMYCPGMVEPQYAATAGMFGGASLITGICAGIVFSMAMPEFVSRVSWTI